MTSRGERIDCKRRATGWNAAAGRRADKDRTIGHARRCRDLMRRTAGYPNGHARRNDPGCQTKLHAQDTARGVDQLTSWMMMRVDDVGIGHVGGADNKRPRGVGIFTFGGSRKRAHDCVRMRCQARAVKAEEASSGTTKNLTALQRAQREGPRAPSALLQKTAPPPPTFASASSPAAHSAAGAHKACPPAAYRKSSAPRDRSRCGSAAPPPASG